VGEPPFECAFDLAVGFGSYGPPEDARVGLRSSGSIQEPRLSRKAGDLHVRSHLQHVVR
jgi:hypothetical protein